MSDHGAGSSYPLSGLRVLEIGSRTAAPYLSKLFVDGGADVVKVESPRGDTFRAWSASGAPVPDGGDGAWFRFLNAGKRSVVVDLRAEADRAALFDLVGEADLVIDDHAPADAAALAITAGALRLHNPTAVVATLTPFGSTGPWCDRPANDFVLQALTGSINGRGVPGEEPVAVGGDLGQFVGAALASPAVVAATFGARASGAGAHIDISIFEAMMWAFQQFRAMYDQFAPAERIGRQIEIPSIEPSADGLVGFCTITGQQWHDFATMIGAPEWIDDPELSGFDGRMARRREVWERIAAFTSTRTSDELCELASAFRIPTGPVGTGDVVATFDHFVDQGFFVENPHGFTQPRSAYELCDTDLAPIRRAPRLGEHAGFQPKSPAAAELGADSRQPLAGIKVLDLTAFFAGPYATNLLRVLGADLVKVESHVRLDGMRWASGLDREMLWEWSPPYHGVNVGKTVVNLDLGSPRARELVEQLIADADVVVENFSPRVLENWGLTWERIHELNPAAVFVRMPAFGTAGPWRDRTGFAMTMEQVSGLANRTGHLDGPPLVPKGPVDFLAGSHAAFAVVMALATRARTGRGQRIEAPLIGAALQAAAEQVVEWTANGEVLTRNGNRSPLARPQGLYESAHPDVWVAVSIETTRQWEALVGIVDGLAIIGRDGDPDRLDAALAGWIREHEPEPAAAELWTAGIPAAVCVHFNDSGKAAQLHQRGFYHWAEHPVTGWTPYHNYPFQIDGEYLPVGGVAPTLGEHNDRVLRGLDLDDDAIAELEASGVTGDWPAMVPRPS